MRITEHIHIDRPSSNPENGGTLASFDWSFFPKTLLMRLATPLLGRTLKNSTKDELAGLKRYAEDGAR